MPTSRDVLPARWRVGGSLRRHAAPHAVAVLFVGLATVVGAVAALAFQWISARALGVESFGLLGAFLGILNVAAVASAALQNTVAVRTAEIIPLADAVTPRRRGPSEATILGVGGALVVVAFAPLLVHTLDTTFEVVLLAAAAIPLAFWMSEAVGVIQGAGRSAEAVWWTTISLVGRVALLLVAWALGLGVGGVLAAVLVSVGVAVLGSRVSARKVHRAGQALFSRTGVTVLLLSMVSAWVVNSDVIVIRATAAGTVAGNFASAAVLVKASFLLPAALSVYLLPRFVSNRGNERLVRLGQRVTVGLTAVSGIALAVVFGLLGSLIVRLVYGPSYAATAPLLFPLALAYLPWIMAQSVLIRLTARASRPAVVVLVVAAVVQLVAFLVVAPDVTALIRVQGVVGVVVLAVLFELVRRLKYVQIPEQGIPEQEGSVT
jgi:O-antigen/teichoic acid export membrane protein